MAREIEFDDASKKDLAKLDKQAVRPFPPPEILGRLALSNSGFVFDPVSGASYTVNASGLAILRALQGGCNDIAEVVAVLDGEFDVLHTVLEREVIEFASRLRGVFQ